MNRGLFLQIIIDQCWFSCSSAKGVWFKKSLMHQSYPGKRYVALRRRKRIEERLWVELVRQDGSKWHTASLECHGLGCRPRATAKYRHSEKGSEPRWKKSTHFVKQPAFSSQISSYIHFICFHLYMLNWNMILWIIPFFY